MTDGRTERPPSVDALARRIAADCSLPAPLLVDAARAAIAAGEPDSALERARVIERRLLTAVVNGTGVLLHTNLGRAPYPVAVPARALSVELDLASGERGSRQRGVGSLLARLTGAEAAMVVNNNAAAVLLVLAALAGGRHVLVSRGESVEIGGGFRVPEVMEQSGARLVDVGTTNRTRVADYAAARDRPDVDAALVLKVHPSNYRIEGFVEDVAVTQLATLGLPVVADIGSGLLDAGTPWLPGGPPTWLAGEPAARQTLAAGADLVTFSGDKLLGGPQAGIIAGRASLLAACARHPLARALRPGGLVLAALQDLAVSYLERRAALEVPFWRMASLPADVLARRAVAIAERAGQGRPVPLDAIVGAGSVPGAVIPSYGLAIEGDHLRALRAGDPPVIARVRDGRTLIDLRTVDPADDEVVAAALAALPCG